ncbi:MAG: FecR domain-containing protein, partial [Bacteroidetes bacterium]|nr:FecR domain-containing protein [Bacteroidota bacterium]
FWFFKNVLEEPTQKLATNEASQTFELTDGSVVNLNKTSSIRYSQEKESGARRVQLEGDAFFDVKRDEQHPFIIQTQGVEIEVLGTAFYVDSRKDQPEIQVIVESGSVSVTAGGSSEVLAANEKAVFVKENQELMKVINQDPNFASLKTNVLKFDSTRMEEVVFALNRQFRANISLENENQKECLLNGTYNNLPLDSILIYIDAYGLKPVRKASGIVLTGNCE